ncbi:GFA family protein [Pseudoalteromonas luteoviolacea]
MTACHCRMCQKYHGSAFAVFSCISKAKLSIDEEESLQFFERYL